MRSKLSNNNKHRNIIFPDYVDNVILQYQKECGYATYSEAIRDMIINGINFHYFIKGEQQIALNKVKRAE